MTQSWSPDSWRSKQAQQMPCYSDLNKLKVIEHILATRQGLVSIKEINTLKDRLAQVSAGEAFLLQGGDCAESFKEFSVKNVQGMFSAILRMAVILTFYSYRSIVKVGRIAGQFAKPRSCRFENRDGVSLPVYRGDIVNDICFSKATRTPDPQRMLMAYDQSAATWDILKKILTNEKQCLESTCLSDIKSENSKLLIENGIEHRQSSLFYQLFTDKDFAKVLDSSLWDEDFYISHEALLLPYEEALTRRQSQKKNWYNHSAHLLWIGERTRQLDGAHVEYIRGIKNPVGVKIGPSMDTDELVKLLHSLNPENDAGRVNLIIRMGVDRIDRCLPPLIRAVQCEGLSVIWSSDPMHGNTVISDTGYKTRKITSVLNEIKYFFQIHRSEGSYAGGVHLELTGQDVTECVGGMYQTVEESSLGRRYHTHCDPRMNASQSLEVALMMAETLQACKRELPSLSMKAKSIKQHGNNFTELCEL